MMVKLYRNLRASLPHCGIMWAQVLEKIEESRRSIVHTEERLKSTVNTLIFENIPMDSLIVDDDSMLSFINETLSKCGELKNR